MDVDGNAEIGGFWKRTWLLCGAAGTLALSLFAIGLLFGAAAILVLTMIRCQP
jgi:hypothetical protein